MLIDDLNFFPAHSQSIPLYLLDTSTLGRSQFIIFLNLLLYELSQPETREQYR